MKTWMGRGGERAGVGEGGRGGREECRSGMVVVVVEEWEGGVGSAPAGDPGGGRNSRTEERVVRGRLVGKGRRETWGVGVGRRQSEVWEGYLSPCCAKKMAQEGNAQVFVQRMKKKTAQIKLDGGSTS